MIGDAEIALRLAAAAALGSAIGFERERRLWAAGIRTHMLVAVGACLFAIVSAYGFQKAVSAPGVVLDPSRVAAQVVSGVGFLGAGAILLRGQVVRGLTTAASIWTVAAVGLAAGGGLYFAAAVSTVIVLAILAGVEPLEDAYRARMRSCTLDAGAERGAITDANVKKLLGLRAGQIRRLVIHEPAGEAPARVAIGLVRVSDDDIARSLARLRRSAGVRSAEVATKRPLALDPAP